MAKFGSQGKLSGILHSIYQESVRRSWNEPNNWLNMLTNSLTVFPFQRPLKVEPRESVYL